MVTLKIISAIAYEKDTTRTKHLKYKDYSDRDFFEELKHKSVRKKEINKVANIWK